MKNYAQISVFILAIMLFLFICLGLFSYMWNVLQYLF